LVAVAVAAGEMAVVVAVGVALRPVILAVILARPDGPVLRSTGLARRSASTSSRGVIVRLRMARPMVFSALSAIWYTGCSSELAAAPILSGIAVGGVVFKAEVLESLEFEQLDRCGHNYAGNKCGIDVPAPGFPPFLGLLGTPRVSPSAKSIAAQFTRCGTKLVWKAVNWFLADPKFDKNAPKSPSCSK
jgi:hypothetical protein